MGTACPQGAVAYVAAHGQEEEEGGSYVGTAHDARYSLSVYGVSGKEKPGQQAPATRPQQQAWEAREQGGRGAV